MERKKVTARREQKHNYYINHSFIQNILQKFIRKENYKVKTRKYNLIQ